MNILSKQKIEDLKIKANNIRKNIIEMLAEAGSGHTAGSLGMVDIFTLFYFHILKHKPENPLWEDRDRLVLSNGHICPVLYATLAEAGYFLIEELKTLRKFGARLQGHPHREYLPYTETSSGPLGEGLSQAVGMALADKIDQKDKERFIYCFISDGELNEGNTWEAVMLAAKYNLDNLIVIVDRNNIQISGLTEDILPLESIKDKFQAFNWLVFETSGHDFKEINNQIELAQSKRKKPKVIIAQTIPAKGIKNWENDYTWHGKAPNQEEKEKALIELEELKNNFTI